MRVLELDWSSPLPSLEAFPAAESPDCSNAKGADEGEGEGRMDQQGAPKGAPDAAASEAGRSGPSERFGWSAADVTLLREVRAVFAADVIYDDDLTGEEQEALSMLVSRCETSPAPCAWNVDEVSTRTTTVCRVWDTEARVTQPCGPALPPPIRVCFIADAFMLCARRVFVAAPRCAALYVATEKRINFSVRDLTGAQGRGTRGWRGTSLVENSGHC